MKVFFLCRVSPSGGNWGGIPPLPEKLACPPHVPPTVLTQKCQFCHFHAVFGHLVQITPPTSRPQLGNPVMGPQGPNISSNIKLYGVYYG